MTKHVTKRGLADWPALELEYVMGTMTQRQLADDHGIAHSTVTSQAAKRNWQAKRDQKRAETSKAVEAVTTTDRIAQQAAQNASDAAIATELMARVRDMFSEAVRPQDLKALSGAAKDAQAIARLALGMTTDNTGVSGIDGGPLDVISKIIISAGPAKDN